MTTDKLAGTIADVLDINFDRAQDMMNRAHREDKYKKDIYANFYSWLGCEWIIEAFRKDSIQIYADYKYGPRTTVRKNEALSCRKQLKADGEIVKGFVKYPAQLMGKFALPDDVYTMHKDFSKMKIAPKKDNNDLVVRWTTWGSY